jgi:hypothetical protein
MVFLKGSNWCMVTMLFMLSILDSSDTSMNTTDYTIKVARNGSVNVMGDTSTCNCRMTKKKGKRLFPFSVLLFYGVGSTIS